MDAQWKTGTVRWRTWEDEERGFLEPFESEGKELSDEEVEGEGEKEVVEITEIQGLMKVNQWI